MISVIFISSYNSTVSIAIFFILTCLILTVDCAVINGKYNKHEIVCFRSIGYCYGVIHLVNTQSFPKN